ncbi:DUF397 domain-containing protein [Streptomyces sp. NPDC014802]|uniref:DUF397 domain-containing protein n=1 Tax=unclassified Streptomyces TaxID=2593676 RepID=UPI0036FA79FF
MSDQMHWYKSSYSDDEGGNCVEVAGTPTTIHPHADADFARLRERERDLARYIDHLNDGQAMGYKAIAAHHPRYGQQAVRSSTSRKAAATDTRRSCPSAPP